MQVSPTTVGGPITSRRTSGVKYVSYTIPSLIETSDLPCVVHRQSVVWAISVISTWLKSFVDQTLVDQSDTYVDMSDQTCRIV